MRPLRPEVLYYTEDEIIDEIMDEAGSHTAGSDSLDSYIAGCPENVQATLNELRATIRGVAPGATETMRYFEMPGYSYPGYDYNGLFVWFGLKIAHRPVPAPSDDTGPREGTRRLRYDESCCTLSFRQEDTCHSGEKTGEDERENNEGQKISLPTEGPTGRRR